ncbi:MAG: NUDIX domain-containing protein [Clostridia bacterium]|nr:NUDIX domain-containing protein [Clostridia bacterium]
MKTTFSGSTACYLMQGEKLLFIKFKKKWAQVYAPPGGKMEHGETPTECIIREFYEETGLTLINPTLKVISHWYNQEEDGLIYVYTAAEYSGELKRITEEGNLFWMTKEEAQHLEQFPMNQLFFDCLFEEGIFEGKFRYDIQNTSDPERILEHSLRKI